MLVWENLGFFTADTDCLDTLHFLSLSFIFHFMKPFDQIYYSLYPAKALH